MDITWYGLSCFRMLERGTASIVADPFSDTVGYGQPNLKADIVTVSHDAEGHNAVENVRNATLILDRPGEYEIGGVFINGVVAYDTARSPEEMRRNIIFVYDFDKVTVCHLGDLDHVPKQQEIEALGNIDVLLVPVGGGGALNSSQASEVISLIEPSIVVPMHYKTDHTPFDLDPVDKFLKEMGLQTVEETDLLRVNKSTLASEDTQVVLLQITGDD